MNRSNLSGWGIAAIACGLTAVAIPAVSIASDIDDVIAVCMDAVEDRYIDPSWKERCLDAAEAYIAKMESAREALRATEIEVSAVPGVFDPIPIELRPGTRTRDAILEHLRSRGDGRGFVEFEVEETFASE